MFIDLAQAQQEILALRQEQAEFVVQREQAEAEMNERAQHCADAAEKHRQDLEQSKRELQKVRHELEQSRGEIEKSRRELQQVGGELEQAREDLQNSHRDVEKIRCEAIEQKEKYDDVDAKLAGCREAMAAEQALLKQQIAALQLDRAGRQEHVALDSDTTASHAPTEACEKVTSVVSTDLVSDPKKLVPAVHQAQLNVNEGVPRSPTGLPSDVDRQLSAMRVQCSFRLSRLRKQLDAAVAGTPSIHCIEDLFFDQRA
eukprot:COSAG02_NODE_2011_length_10119_cov_11.569960_2_plen_258_part_00